MKSLLRQLAVFVVILSALVLPPGAGKAAEDKNAGLFVNLTSLDTGMAGHALVFADKALKRGHPVVVFLNHKAVLIAAKSVPHAAYHGKPLAEHLKVVIGAGGKVIVCQMCLTDHGMKETDLMEGAVRGSTELVHGYLFDPAYKVMSW